MKNLPILVLAICCSYLSQAQTARIQFIHNSADVSIGAIDIYVDGTLVADSLLFHSATPFMNITAGAEVSIAVCPGSSADASEAFYTLQNTFISSEKYIAVGNGVVQTGYDPQVFFELSLHSGALETGTNTSAVDVIFCNGSTDSNILDLNETDLLLLPIFEDVVYGSFSGYQSFLTADYVFEIIRSADQSSVGKFAAPFAQNTFGGLPVTIVSSGFQNQQMNQGGNGFGLWMSKPLGGPMYELPVIELNLSSGLQVINNIADPMSTSLDIYLNNELLADNLMFRSATALQNIQATEEMILGIASSTSSSVEDCFFRDTVNFLSGSLQTALLIGNVDETGFNPSVTVDARYFDRVPYPGEVSMLFVHGSTDHAPIDFVENEPEQNVWADDLSYGDSSVEWMLPAANYVAELTSTDGAVSYGLSVVPLEFLQGQMATILLSGYADPSQNQSGPEAGLWLATDTGGMLVELNPPAPAPVYTEVQFIHNTADASLAELDIYADGILILNNFAFHSASPYLNLQADVPIDISVAFANSNSADDSFMNFTYVLNEDQPYLFVADGIYSLTGYNPAPDFQFSVYEGSRLEASSSTESDIIFYQGCTDLPEVMIKDMSDLSTWAPEISHQDFSDYITLESGSEHGPALIANSGEINLGQFALNVLTPEWDGKSVTILFNGFLNPSNNEEAQPLQCWYATSDGSTGILGTYTDVSQTEATTTSVFPVPAHDRIYIRLSNGFLSSPDVMIMTVDGRIVKTGLQKLQPGIHELDLGGMSCGIYTLRISDGIHAETIHFSVD
ncbi:MAG: DUF4397 domain-containing protein [Flavobacteriales bacterium]|nr:DUF4397 domain-containing protein [Flavobacteriales bacterium]